MRLKLLVLVTSLICISVELSTLEQEALDCFSNNQSSTCQSTVADWVQTQSCSPPNGIYCSPTYEVTSLDLTLGSNGNGYKDTTTIPTELGYLTNLISMTLTSLTYVKGTIPTEVGYLSQLQEWSMNFPEVSGTLPTEVGNVYNLQHLFLSQFTLLSGTIPTEVGSLSSLQFLSFFVFVGLSGTLPKEMSKLTMLDYFELNHVQSISGTLSPAFLSLASLKYFALPLTPLIELNSSVLSSTLCQNHGLSYCYFQDSIVSCPLPDCSLCKLPINCTSNVVKTIAPSSYPTSYQAAASSSSPLSPLSLALLLVGLSIVVIIVAIFCYRICRRYLEAKAIARLKSDVQLTALEPLDMRFQRGTLSTLPRTGADSPNCLETLSPISFLDSNNSSALGNNSVVSVKTVSSSSPEGTPQSTPDSPDPPSYGNSLLSGPSGGNFNSRPIPEALLDVPSPTFGSYEIDLDVNLSL